LIVIVLIENSKAAEPKDTLKENAKEIKDTTDSLSKDIRKTLSSKDNSNKKA